MFIEPNVKPKFDAFVKNTGERKMRAAVNVLLPLVRQNIEATNMTRYEQNSLQIHSMSPNIDQAIYYTLVNNEDPPASWTLGDEGNIYKGLRDALDKGGVYLTKENALHAPKLTSPELETIVKAWNNSPISKLIKGDSSPASLEAKKRAERARNDFERFTFLYRYYQDPANKHQSFREALDNSSVFTSQLNVSETKKNLEVFSNKPVAKPEEQGTNRAGFFGHSEGQSKEREEGVEMKSITTGSSPKQGQS